MTLSPVANHPDQPTVCCVCGEKVLKTKHAAMFYYDDTPAKQHWTRHATCKQV